MGTRYPGAVYRPVAYRGLMARQPNAAMLLHTNGGGGQLYGWWQQVAAKGSTIGAQYQVFWDGSSECYTDPSLVTYHAYSASRWAFGVETQDDSDPSKPWTDAQILTIARIGVHHGVPAKLLDTSQPGDGVGWHQKYDAWNQSSHNCPGSVRVRQIPDVLAAMADLTKPPAPAPVPAAATCEVDLSTLPILSVKSPLLSDADLPGNPVKAGVQANLMSRGYLPFVQSLLDGVYGSTTAAAVKTFQSKHGLTADGVVGQATWNELLVRG